MVATFLGFAVEAARHPRLARWLDRVQSRPAVAQDNVDVLETLQRLQAEQSPAFDPYRVQWRSDRLEWVIKNGFAAWFIDELQSGRAFFPLTLADG
jgi:hypothetical protein